MSIPARATSRYLWGRPAQLALVILGVALGVAVVVAVDLANAAAARAFSLSSDAVTGRATHIITGGPAGLDEAAYVKLRQAGITQAAPVVEAYGRVRGPRGEETLHVLGIDPFAEAGFRSQLESIEARDLRRLITEPNTALLADVTAQRLGLAPGTTFVLHVAGRSQVLTLLGLLSTRASAGGVVDGMLIADISTAQELSGQIGRLSSIDLVIPEGNAGERLLARIAALLPTDATVHPAAARSNELVQMTRAFRTNLTAMSLLALLVGTFLIYNTITFSVLQRRALLGSLRVLGVTRAEIFRLILAEAALVGAIGSALGVIIGIGIGKGLLHLVARTINDLYFVVQVTELPLLPAPFIKGFSLGLLATVFASIVPATEAANTSPRLALHRSGIEARARRATPWFALLGLVMTAIAGLVLLLVPRSLLFGFAALFLLILGLTLITPFLVAAISRAANSLVSHLGLTARLALRSISASLSRTGVAIAALMLAVATTVGVGIMVASLRGSVEHWLQVTLSADVYISSPSVGAQASVALDPRMVDLVRNIPGIAWISAARHTEVPTALGPVEVLALDPPQHGTHFLLREGRASDVWPAYDAGKAIVITESFAYRHGLHPGSELSLRTRAGLRAFPIAGVLADYSSEQGMILMNRSLYQRQFDDPTITSLRLYVAPAVAPDSVVNAVRAALNRYEDVVVRSNRDLRKMSLDIFDRTFTITRVLRLLAVVVAFVGILSALMALQLERAREFALLRAQGMTSGEVQSIVTLQTGVMGLIAGVLALPVGVLLALVLIHVINRRAFGWTMQTVVPPEVLIEAILLAVTAALIAGLYPGWRLGRALPAQALREE